ncbi:MAG: hypothetical protein Q7R97_01865 [Candidatus Daviesbacteria bacterium]|nr:hypothetical protein [Candidatus Daviesbacteria bacterium]
MGNYDRGRGDREGRGRGFSRGGFNSPRFAGGAGDRGSRGPVEMHQAVCDNCKKSCEVPFRPTSGKPIYCSSCFGHNRDSDSRSERYSSKGGPSSGWEDRGSRSEDVKEMFDTVCDECGNSCQVPFKPTSGKPIYCSNCFGEKKNANPRNDKGDLEQLNAKLDQILAILSPKKAKKEIVEEIIEEMPIKELPITVEKKVRKSNKKSSAII